MTRAEAARRVGVTERTIDRWIASGRLETRVLATTVQGKRVREITIGALQWAETHCARGRECKVSTLD